MAKPHVPKFGNWANGNEDIPYTAYFENARRERGAGGGLYTNLYDPQQSPPHVSNYSSSIGNASNHRRSRGSDRKSHSGHPEAEKRDGVAAAGSSSFSSPDASKSKHRRSRQRSYPSDDNNRGHERVGSIPKFGAWDENDPTSGEGYTVIFQQARRDKESPFSAVAESPEATHRRKNQASSFRSKVCCCLSTDTWG